MRGKRNALTVLIGGNVEADYRELFSGKPLKGIAQPKNTLYLESYSQLDRLLSPKKIDLLRYLMEEQSQSNPKSVSQIAKELHRKQEAISRDLAHLKNLGMVALKRFKQTVYAFPAYSSINIRVC